MNRLIDSEWHQIQSGYPGRLGCGQLVDKDSKMFHLAMYSDIRAPFTKMGYPSNAAIRRTGPGIVRLILPVLGLCRDSQITAPTIKTISVDVIAFKPVSGDESQQSSMQANRWSSTIDSLTPASVAVRVEEPIPAIDERSVSSVDQNVGSDRAVTRSEGDRYGILIGHRDSNGLGVLPPDVSSIAGALPSYFTTLDRAT